MSGLTITCLVIVGLACLLIPWLWKWLGVIKGSQSQWLKKILLEFDAQEEQVLCFYHVAFPIRKPDFTICEGLILTNSMLFCLVMVKPEEKMESCQRRLKLINNYLKQKTLKNLPIKGLLITNNDTLKTGTNVIKNVTNLREILIAHQEIKAPLLDHEQQKQIVQKIVSGIWKEANG